jgi:hypothetical protein
MLISIGAISNTYVLETGLLVGFLLGLALGIFLVKNTHGIEMLTLLLKTPILLIKSPGKIKTRLKVWQEFRIKAKARKIERRKKIDKLNQKIQGLRQEIKSIETEIRRIKWLAKEPQEASENK